MAKKESETHKHLVNMFHSLYTNVYALLSGCFAYVSKNTLMAKPKLNQTPFDLLLLIMLSHTLNLSLSLITPIHVMSCHPMPHTKIIKTHPMGSTLLFSSLCLTLITASQLFNHHNYYNDYFNYMF